MITVRNTNRVMPAGLTATRSYDEWLRASNVFRTTGDQYARLTTDWRYDARGFATNITEQNAGAITGPNPKVILRAFDAYGQLASETVTLNGALVSGAFPGWNAAGRRTALSLHNPLSAVKYAFTWRADGLLAGVSTPSGSASYGYDSAGVLTNRTAGSRTTRVTSRDGAGRPWGLSTTVNSAAVMNEALSWNDDGTLSTHTLYRTDFTDWRAYSYADYTRRLTQERLNLDAATRWTNVFEYDSGGVAGPGVLTKVGQASWPAQWSGGVSPFARVNTETNASVRRLAYGRLNGPATVSAQLDGRPLPASVNATPDPAWSGRWQTMMELSPGAHQLTVLAAHPSGQFATNAVSWFTNALAGEDASVLRDRAGNITRKIWRNRDGSTNRIQYLYWDAKGRLYQAMETDKPQQNGYLWLAEYDGLNRRLQTKWYVTTNGMTYIYGVTPTTINQHYDPAAEFLELGVSVANPGGTGAGNATTWKLCGPDLNGVYGGLNGTGGFDAAMPGGNQFEPTISDARGNVLGSVSNGVVAWTAARPTGYGSVAGHRPLPLAFGGSLVQSSAWRGRWVDITGYYNVGLRLYDPQAGSWLSYDPVWNNRDPNYLTFCAGDPINYFDADGRWGKAAWNAINRAMGAYGEAESTRIQFTTGGIEAAARQSVINTRTVYNRAISDGAGFGAAFYEAAAYEVGNFTGYTPAYEGFSSFDIAGAYRITDPYDKYPRIGFGIIGIAATGRSLQVIGSYANASMTAYVDDLLTAEIRFGPENMGGIPNTSPVRVYNVGTFEELQFRSVVGDMLDLDHQPSHAANVARAQAQLGRPLTPVEIENIRYQGTSVAVPQDWHRTQSPTYGGRNTPAQIQADAANPAAGGWRDSQAMINGASATDRAAAEAAAAEIRRRAGGN
jgi:RHS repeat-associated protein